MADDKHLEILQRGTGEWNRWRTENPAVIPNLAGANLSEANLSYANLGGADVREADLSSANLTGANLHRTHLSMVSLHGACLYEADLREADLRGAYIILADLRQADLTKARMDATVVADVYLSDAKGLETVRHEGPSTIGIDTIYSSHGQIPEVFLRGAGVPETFIAYARSLVISPIEFYSCFISYSGRDDEFAQRLYADLQSKGVRCWFAPENLKIGDRFRDRIEESIRLHDKLLIVLSANSINSPWVQTEVEAALERERREQRSVLFPISIDDAFKDTAQAWAADLRRTRHIGDFSHWKDHDSYKKALDRLLRDLAADTAPEPRA